MFNASGNSLRFFLAHGADRTPLASWRSPCRLLTNLQAHHCRSRETDANTNAVAGLPLERLKHPARGGQNLSRQYARLERALRGKEEYLRGIEAYATVARASTNQKARTPESTSTSPTSKIVAGKTPLMFAGFVVPDGPQPPQPDECCMSGCAVCVHDLYQESLEAYDSAVDALRASLTARGIPESEWPVQIRAQVRKKDAVRSAFEQMELQLAAKRNANANADRPKPEPETAVRLDEPRAGGYGATITSPNKSSRLAFGAKPVLEALSWIVFSLR